MAEPTNMFRVLAGLDWKEDPELTLHSWRIRVPCCRVTRLYTIEGYASDSVVQKPQLQVEFMRGIGHDSMAFCTAIISPVHDGVRGAEYVIDRPQLHALRDLLNASDLSGDYHREVKQKPSPPSPEEPRPCGFDEYCDEPAAICLVCAWKVASFQIPTPPSSECACGCGRPPSICTSCANKRISCVRDERTL